MQVTVEVWPWLGELVVGKPVAKVVLSETLAEGASLGALLEHLGRQHHRLGQALVDPRTGDPTSRVQIVLRREGKVAPIGPNTELREGDTVLLMAGIAGGRR